ncbi:MAG: hypothetical protein CVU61_15790 [Deltaproteobacteria bacterium HGW-Deltaproteobacteria-19]|jgi:PAS domain S-box-containing protein|nr:MAG: hypothetical protein CVU61_15790 [Deltaproteobacteria bacterium HGW-Deltaproteobacteria-19]
MKTSPKTKRPFVISIAIFALLSLGVGLSGYAYYLSQEKELRMLKSEELTTVVNLKVHQIINWRAERISDARMIQASGPVVRMIREYIRNPSAGAVRDDIVDWFESFHEIKEYESILLLDREQRVRLALGNKTEAIGRTASSLAKKTMESGQIEYSNLRLGEVRRVIRWDIFIPLAIEEGRVRIPIGVVMLRVDPHHFLYPLIQSWSTPSPTAETLLVRRDGDHVLFLNELRHRKGAAISLRLPLSNSRLPAAAAVQNREGIMEGTDYRGVPVLAAMRSVPDTGIFIISKIDSREIYAPLRRHAWMILLIVMAMIGMAGAMILVVWHIRQAESYHQLYESEKAGQDLLERYRVVADNTYDWEFWIGPDGRFIFNSPSCERITGYPAEEFDRDPRLILNIIHPEDRTLYRAHVREDVPVHRPGNITFRIIRPDGEVRWLEHVCLTIVNIDGTSLGQRGSNRDVTDRIMAKETLKRRTELLEEANRELESFSYSVSHDLRAPLRAIDGFAKMLLRDGTGEPEGETRRKLGIIRENAQRMGQLIDDLLALSRLGRQSMSWTVLDMKDLVGEAWRHQAISDMTTRAELILGSLPPACGDRALVRVVLANLLSNAIKYSRNRQNPVIEVGGRSDEKETVYFVKDNGVGFDMLYSEKLYGVFQRLHNADDYEGTGVGLAIVQRAIHRHGGRVWAEGTVEGGATFYFTLPETGPGRV